MPNRGLYFNEYQLAANSTASYKDPSFPEYAVPEEVGELMHEFAIVKRKGVELNVENVKGEIGDVLWGLSQLARECGLTLEECAEHNMKKLAKRLEEGTIHDKENRDE